MQIESGMRVHFVGIAGSGMSPLARILIDLGCSVSGSDIKRSAVLDELMSKGAEVYTGHDASVASKADMLIVSAAVPQDDVELEAARSLNIPVLTRAELLGLLMNPRFGIAVTGTHGKTTTSSMVSLILENAGLDTAFVVGSSFSGISGGGKLGKSDLMVVEADEAYGSFLKLNPSVAVVTNIDDDHRDYYGSFEGILNGFREFLGRIKPDGIAIMCSDDDHVRNLILQVERRVVTYGVHTAADYTVTDVEVNGFGTSFTVIKGGEKLGSARLNVPGIHNISNALAAIAVADQLGVDFESIRKALQVFEGARRRCQILSKKGSKVMVIDDYAHHPAEINATLLAVKQIVEQLNESADAKGVRRLISVFQPQRYTRTKFLKDEFTKAFKHSDFIIVTEIYAEGTGECPIPGVNGRSLAEAISKYEERNVEFLPDSNAIIDFLKDLVRDGDFVVFMGAGDINKTACKFADELEG